METKYIILQLIKNAISEGSNAADSLSISDDQWREIMDVAAAQGVSGICLDGVEHLGQKPDFMLLMEWIAQVSQWEEFYERYRKAISGLASFYASEKLRMMLLKGYGLSLFWPVPKHRPAGDIDIYLFGKWKEADELIHSKLGISVDNGHHHHSVFMFQNTMVENHYDFINVHSHHSNAGIEGVFKALAMKGEEVADSEIPNLYYPSPDLNALFVARHSAAHFAAERMTLRQVLDWAFLVKASSAAVDWRLFWEKAELMGMMDFVLCLNRICIEYLGFDAALFHLPESADLKEELTERMLDDIFYPEDGGKDLEGLSYIWHRTKLWWKNRWKHRMVYSDSLPSTFLSQLKSHLMKPKSILGK